MISKPCGAHEPRHIALVVAIAFLSSFTLFPASAFAADTIVFLTSGSTWSVPGDYGACNTIEVIGGGGSGGTRRQNSSISAAGTGGGGGAYSKISNLALNPGATVTVAIGAAGSAVSNSGGALPGNAGGNTWFNGASCAAAAVCAKGGAGGSNSQQATANGGAGGDSASGIGTIKYSGGRGGNMTSAGIVTIGTGGGGAAGPNGAGSNGGDTGTTGASSGGNADAGSGGAGGGGASTGGSGTEYDGSHGSGGGGGGQASVGAGTATAGSGGNYGGGGGGTGVSNTSATAVSGAGIQGLIIITYSPNSFGCHNTITITKRAVVTGDASVIGTISKGSGTFVIDHPLDPKNKLLYHSFVESPDAKNLYDGTATIDKYGEATIILPRYFMALNKDYVYLASAIGMPMPNLHLKRGVRREWFFGAPSFRIAGGEPGGRISWQVTGTRKDPFILKHPIIPEVWKTDSTIVPKGECIFAPLCK